MSDHPMAVPDCVSSASSSQHQPSCEGAGQGEHGARAGRPSEGSKEVREVRKCRRKQRKSEVVCHHAVPQAHAGVLTEEVVEEMRAESGARIMLDASASPMAGGTLVTITGVADQIEAAVRCIRQRTGSQGAISEHAQTFWREWVEDAWPDLDSGPHFLPPVYFNRVPTSCSQVAGQNIRVFCQPFGQAGGARHPGTSHPEFVRCPNQETTLVSDCQTRDDSATQRVFFCLKTLYTTNNEVLVGLTNLQFEQYLSDPWYTLAAAELPVPSRASEILPNVCSRGDFDFLLIHRHYGLVVCEVKALGDNVQELEMSQQEFEGHLKERLLRAVSQLDKAEAMLSYLVSDIAQGLRISKTIALPNISACQMSKVISNDTELTQELSRCLKASDPTDIVDLCLCADRLSDPSAPWDVRSETLTELGKWWQRCVTHVGEDSHMTSDVYKTLVARFCGPPTTVTVPSIFPARLCVKTLHQAVSWTGECHACLTLFPEQAHLLNAAPPRVFLTGPPGTGKTVVLQLMATQWLLCGNDVYVVSTWRRSRAACIMLHHLLQQTFEAQPSAVRGQVHLLLYDLDSEESVKRAVGDLSERSTSLYVIADEAGPDERSARFQTFCEKLQTRVSGLHLWAASCRHGIAPEGLEVKAFTRPLRSPPVVAREVGKAGEIHVSREVQGYIQREVPDLSDGPPVNYIYHYPDHTVEWVEDCVRCGKELTDFLRHLHVGTPGEVSTTAYSSNGVTAPPLLQFRDVLVLGWGGITKESGLVRGVKEGGVPVRVVTDEDIEDVAKACSDVIWVADGDQVRGLERKVVICVEDMFGRDVVYLRLQCMSRCTSQLVVLSRFPPNLEPDSDVW